MNIIDHVPMIGGLYAPNVNPDAVCVVTKLTLDHCTGREVVHAEGRDGGYEVVCCVSNFVAGFRPVALQGVSL